MWPIDQIPEIVFGDLDAEFIKSIAIAMAWEYDSLYESLIPYAPGIPDSFLNEEFSLRRGNCATKALASTCQRHGVPFEFKRLECNGQRKILTKVGRLVLIQEPMATLTDHPKFAEYKLELAETHGILRQPEFDLNDVPGKILDWSGCILGVMLHGAAGPWFTREHKALGGLVLGIPDAAYDHWIHRFDLLRIAMFGRDAPVEEPPSDHETQQDRVRVTLKNRNAARGTDQ